MTTALKPLVCDRCDHSWYPRVESPQKCPKCGSFKWNESERGNDDA